MAFTLNGIGTTFYGQCDFWPDGSYVTTEWFVVLWLPVIPIKSLRIMETKDSTYAVVYASESYHVLREEYLCVKQVLFTYLFTTFYIGIIALAFYLGWAWYFILLSFVVPWLVVGVVREIARTNAAQSPPEGMEHPFDQPAARPNRCHKCDLPLTRDERSSGECPSCGVKLKS